MICVYEPNETDFSMNGLGPVSPTSCTVSETLDGEGELTTEPPIDALGKWRRLHLRKGPGTSFGVAITARLGDTFEAANTDGWVPVAVNGAVLWVAKRYAEEVW